MTENERRVVYEVACRMPVIGNMLVKATKKHEVKTIKEMLAVEMERLQQVSSEQSHADQRFLATGKRAKQPAN